MFAVNPKTQKKLPFASSSFGAERKYQLFFVNFPLTMQTLINIM